MSNWMSKSEIKASIEFYLKSGPQVGRPRNIFELASEIVNSMSNQNGSQDFQAALNELIAEKVVLFDKENATVVLSKTAIERIILTGLLLEQFLSGAARHIANNVFEGADQTTLAKLNVEVAEIGRYYLAGFSKNEIRGERAALKANVFDLLYTSFQELVDAATMTDPVTSQKLRPDVGGAIRRLGIDKELSINDARIAATLGPIQAFVEGDYGIAAELGEYGASVFGRPLFYQMYIIGNARLNREQEAEAAGEAALLGLVMAAPWHFQLAALTLGKTSKDNLLKLCNEDRGRFQVLCFDGLRACTAGDYHYARDVLTRASNMKTDLGMEHMLVDADLRRCSIR
jgi:hypothetical protein